jgi:hypothetical protein
MEISEYAAMAEQGQRKLKRDSILRILDESKVEAFDT